ncbi:hypothetical protein KP509_27G022200 [Ceratopteris richardii]|uniref:Uncharacterized protein n=1 Tax=Ceratopteris richardii TaxID=49495 RepID=A0A8T2RFX4_CERRI|nr:hypothetical protein KP509_27G022200 [Ceratopteris richardii]
MTRIRKRPCTATPSPLPQFYVANLHHHFAGIKPNPSFEDPRHAGLCRSSLVRSDVSSLEAKAHAAHSIFSEKKAKKQLPLAAPSLYCSRPYIASPREAERADRRKQLEMPLERPKFAAERETDVPEGFQEENNSHLLAHVHDGIREVLKEKIGVTQSVIDGIRSFSARRGGKSVSAGSSQLHVYPRSDRIIEDIPGTVDPASSDDDLTEEAPRKVLPLHLILADKPRIATEEAKVKSNLCRSGLPHVDTNQIPVSIGYSFTSISSCRLNGRLNANLQEEEEEGLAREGGAITALKHTASPTPRGQRSPVASDSTSSDTKTRARGKHAARNEATISEQSHDWFIRSWQGYRKPRTCMHQRARTSSIDGCSHVTGELQRQNDLDYGRRIQGKDDEEEKENEEEEEDDEEEEECKKKRQKKSSGNLKQNVVSCSADILKVTKCADQGVGLKAEPFAYPDSAELCVHPVRADSMRWWMKDNEQVARSIAPLCSYRTQKRQNKHENRFVPEVKRQLMALAKPHGVEVRPGDKRPNPQMAGCSIMLNRVAQNAGMISRILHEEEKGNEKKQRLERREAAGGEKEEKREEKEGRSNGSDTQKQYLPVGQPIKLREAANFTTPTRWRKKCKPCIRRLHDIKDRSRLRAPTPVESVTLEIEQACASSSLSSCSGIVWLVKKAPSPSMTSSALPGAPPLSPLPACHLNSDPCEWRPDFQ